MVTNLMTGFTDWIWIGVGAAVLAAITGALVAVNQRLTGRGDGQRTSVTLTATGASQIRDSRLETTGTGSIDMTAAENSKIEQSGLSAADRDIRLRAEGGSEISGTDASSRD
ncbi:hypothetical protein OG462_41415 [Streptomyces sp. NBC_01077]|uniref:hypothetical protein n=1 Tax=Streptomyces sp. NBC_01077 TaxID=2903746 RepID=UPI003864E6E0|nr:hypothetical protein OG462_41415 [Streptomyces sp. NBC_01077]